MPSDSARAKKKRRSDATGILESSISDSFCVCNHGSLEIVYAIPDSFRSPQNGTIVFKKDWQVREQVGTAVGMMVGAGRKQERDGGR